jgi:hypothetical protein
MDKKVVGLYFVDFQKKKNEKLAKAYKITGPTLVLVKVTGNKTDDWKTMPKVWKLVGDKEKFFEYVQDGVTGYLPASSEDDKKDEKEDKKEDDKKDEKKDE